MFDRVIISLLEGRFVRAIVKRLVSSVDSIFKLPIGFMVKSGALERPAHAYCIFHAAVQAQRLGISNISIIEFGVAGGNTLTIVERYARRVAKATGIKIDTFGFDTSEGLPELEGPEDLPYWFYPTQYKMNYEELSDRLVDSQLVIGNIRHTVKTFFDDYSVPTVGVIFIDVDFFSSTQDCFRIFDYEAKKFLPRVFLYFDDIVGSAMEMYGEFNGELRAIDEFNSQRSDIKIHMNRNLLPNASINWRHQIYYGHIFQHPLYNKYIGKKEQSYIEQRVKLRP